MYYSIGAEFKGRADFVRLLFEAAGVPYENVFDPAAIMAGCDFANIGTGFPNPARAPPIVTGPNNFSCSQTPVILHALGKKFGLFPNEDDEINCLSLNVTIADFIGEACNAFHAKDPMGTYASQIEESKPRIEWFINERLPKWLNHLEHWLQVTPDKGASYFFSGKLTYVDLAVFYMLIATESQFNEFWKKDSTISSYPLLFAFKDRIAALPNIKAYLESDRVIPWGGDSMM